MTLPEDAVIFVERAELAGDYNLTFGDGTEQTADFAPFLNRSHNPLIQAYRDPTAFAPAASDSL